MISPNQNLWILLALSLGLFVSVSLHPSHLWLLLFLFYMVTFSSNLREKAIQWTHLGVSLGKLIDRKNSFGKFWHLFWYLVHKSDWIRLAFLFRIQKKLFKVKKMANNGQFGTYLSHFTCFFALYNIKKHETICFELTFLF